MSRAWAFWLVCALAGCERAQVVDLRQAALQNRLAYVPPACFTRVTNDINPCYVCHAQGTPPNHEDQRELQLVYAFPQVEGGREVQNPWRNLLRDRRVDWQTIRDAEVSAYVARENYRGLAERLRQLPGEWDVNGNGRWDGYSPDAGFQADAEGWDRDARGELTGWRAFAYAPLPGGFMPTNGSFDDVLIRLPEAFRRDREGRPDLRVYAANLSIVEALIKRADVPANPALDEHAIGLDLDGDQQLTAARRVHFAWRPLSPDSLHYAGQAELELERGRLQLAPGLYPAGTEFLHSVRYLDVTPERAVVPAARMKELRYARKRLWLTYADLQQRAQHAEKEAQLDPDRPEQFAGDAERGLHGDLGWTYQGFIEDARGELRPQSYEETVSCMGCHTGLPVTTDGSFAWPRKADAAVLSRPDERGEYARYLQHNPSGDGFRANREVHAKFFDEAGNARAEAFAALARDQNELALPSPERALALNKAYWILVQEQSYALGRDAMLEPAEHVLRQVRDGEPTGIREPLQP